MKIEVNKIYKGDCIEVMKTFPDNSFDSIVTDPPYGLEFMGKDWDSFKKEGDSKTLHNIQNEPNTVFAKKNFNVLPRFKINMKQYQQFSYNWAKEALRILKPGGYLLAFSGTRTYHRMVCGIEDAGFEIRDTIQWLYGSGFPKSLNIGKQVAKVMGEDVKQGTAFKTAGEYGNRNLKDPTPINDREQFRHKPVTPEAKTWEGWGTALKPANEPIVVARKPLSEKNVALNVLKHGTGGINIDACRIGTTGGETHKGEFQNKGEFVGGKVDYSNSGVESDYTQKGRFPANIILDEESAKVLDEQSGDIKGFNRPNLRTTKYKNDFIDSDYKEIDFGKVNMYDDKGGASRFFYVAKASKSERNLGMGDLEPKQMYKKDNSTQSLEIFGKTDGGREPRKNNHPTVKPIKLMRYLVRLVTRKNGLVLDPFIGSGTTGIACIKENMNFMGIEQSEEYIKIAEARLRKYKEQSKLKTFV